MVGAVTRLASCGLALGGSGDPTSPLKRKRHDLGNDKMVHAGVGDDGAPENCGDANVTLASARIFLLVALHENKSTDHENKR